MLYKASSHHPCFKRPLEIPLRTMPCRLRTTASQHHSTARFFQPPPCHTVVVALNLTRDEPPIHLSVPRTHAQNAPCSKYPKMSKKLWLCKVSLSVRVVIVPLWVDQPKLSVGRKYPPPGLDKRLRLGLAHPLPRGRAVGEPDGQVAVLVLALLGPLGVRVEDALVDDGQPGEEGRVPLDDVFLRRVSSR